MKKPIDIDMHLAIINHALLRLVFTLYKCEIILLLNGVSFLHRKMTTALLSPDRYTILLVANSHNISIISNPLYQSEHETKYNEYNHDIINVNLQFQICHNDIKINKLVCKTNK